MDLEFSGSVVEWRGPAPYYFVPLPENEAGVVEDHKALLTYGWGVIPVSVRIGETTWTTSLFPRNGRYLVPIRDAVRKAERLELGESADVELSIEIPEWSAPER